MESESGAGGLSYRYAYDIDRSRVVAYYVTSTTGSATQHAYEDTTSELAFTVTHPEYSMVVNNVVKLFYHQDHLGTTDYLTESTDGKVASYVTYDDWGSLTAKAVLKMGVRELDLVQDYTGHPYDMVLGLYYAKARMYDADDRRFMAVDSYKGMITDPATLVQYTYVLNNPVGYNDPTGRHREAGYYLINGVYGWYSDPDASEYGKNSDTYKIIDDLSNRWFATSDAIERQRLHGLAQYVRFYACTETVLIYAQDKSDDQLRLNALTAIDSVYQIRLFLTSYSLSSQVFYTLLKRSWYANMG